MLQNLKLRTRMSVVFAIFAMGALAIGALGAWQIRALQAEIATVPALLDVRGAMTEWQGQTALNAGRTVAILTTEDQGLGDKMAPAMKETTARISVIQKRIEEMPLPSADRERFVAIGEARKKYIAVRDDLLKLRKSGGEGAASAFTEKFTPALKAYERAVASFVEGYAQGQLDKHAAAQAASARMLMLLGAGGILFVVIAAVLCHVLVRSIVKPVQRAVAIANTVADGDLSLAIEVKSRDEMGELFGAMKVMVANLSSLAGEVRSATQSIATSVSEIATGNADLSQRTEQQSSSLQETASSMEELTGTVKQNANNARQANQLAAGASTMAIKGGEVVGQVVHSMSSINESSKKIADIIGVIDGIAFQTNILALNAAVEAARAGEQGRGFAVVASEVRTLAQRSAAAAKEIKTLITDSVARVEDGSRFVDQAGHTMEEIVTAVKHVTDIMAEIAAASQEQTSGIEQINQAITQMDQTTQQNAALVEEAAAAAESMQEQARGLTKAVAIFKLNAEKTAPSPRVRSEARGEEPLAPRLHPTPATRSQRKRPDGASRTQHFRDDHDKFVSLVGKISEKLDSADATQAAAFELADLLAGLSGALKVHLGMEDRVLYPALVASSDPEVQQLARRFQAEMGGLTEGFGAYVTKWRLPASIEGDPHGFAAETKQVFGALAQRIERENNELYAAADALDGATPSTLEHARTTVRRAVNAADEEWREF